MAASRKSVTRSNKLGPHERESALRNMREKELDVLVIGGGIVGTGAALDAVTRGLRVGMLEARDWASGTSSRSSKLIHGGIRYLEQLDFRLVREALIERGLLLQRIAPHLVKPVRFLYPLTKPLSRAPLHRRRHDAVRPVQLHRAPAAGRAASPPPHEAPAAARRAEPASRRLHRRSHLLGRPGRRRPLRREPGTHRELLRRPRREPGAGGGVRQGRAARRRREGARPGDRRALRDPGEAGRQRHGRLDGRDPGHGGRARPVQGAGVARACTWSCRATGSSRSWGCCCAPRRACCSSSRGAGTG